MSIEASPPSNDSHKTSASSSAHAGKGRGKTADAEADGGFNAILGAIDAGTAASQTADTAKSGPTATDAAVVQAQVPHMPQIPLCPPLLPVPQATPSAKVEGDLTNNAGSVPGGAKAKPALPAGQSRGWQANANDGSDAGVPGDAAHNRSVQQAAAADASSNTNANSNATDATTTANSPASDAKDAKMAVAMEFMKAVQAAPMTEQPLPTTAMLKPEKSTGDRISSANQTSDTTTYAAPSLGVSSYSDNASASGSVAPAPEVQVAEQVKYWMSHDVQNAELKLDGLGKDPVQVSISMTGNEAHIAFRTDEATTRGVLEGATAHLKDMLGREGVVLTGVSVGTSSSSGSQADSSGERRPRQGLRQAFVSPAVGAVASSGGRTSATAGRALDLFV